MEVLTDSRSTCPPVLVANAELLETLEKDVQENKKRLLEKRKKRKNFKNKYEHRDFIQEKVLDYLKSTPCVNIRTSKIQELKSKCMSRTKSRLSPHEEKGTANQSSTTGFGLTEAETLQILNFMPTEPVEIHLMVEDLHVRMSETKQEEFLNMIQSFNNSTE